ncbi:MAG: 50S ribosomal protein L18 [Leptospiraceae bacterium]|nr:50S ribosomal protein L18 [Leptospiraceae bacterium]
MDRLKRKKIRQERRVKRVRKATTSKFGRMRLAVNRSNRNIRAQIIDDEKRITLCYAGTDQKDLGQSAKNKDAARKVGEAIAKAAAAKGIKQVYLDRRGQRYHGKILEFANAARENGLEF